MATEPFLAKYASNLVGVRMFALDQWHFWRNNIENGSRDQYDTGFRAGKMKAYSEILRLVNSCKGMTESEMHKKLTI